MKNYFFRKKYWDDVYIWEKLVSLDSNEAKIWYTTAWNIISNLKELKNSTSNTYDEQIKAMEFKIAQALNSLDWVNTWIEDTKNISKSQLENQTAIINTATISLKTAEIKLSENKKNLLLQKEHIITQ